MNRTNREQQRKAFRLSARVFLLVKVALLALFVHNVFLYIAEKLSSKSEDELPQHPTVKSQEIQTRDTIASSWTLQQYGGLCIWEILLSMLLIGCALRHWPTILEHHSSPKAAPASSKHFSRAKADASEPARNTNQSSIHARTAASFRRTGDGDTAPKARLTFTRDQAVCTDLTGPSLLSPPSSDSHVDKARRPTFGRSVFAKGKVPKYFRRYKMKAASMRHLIESKRRMLGSLCVRRNVLTMDVVTIIELVQTSRHRLDNQRDANRTLLKYIEQAAGTTTEDATSNNHASGGSSSNNNNSLMDTGSKDISGSHIHSSSSSCGFTWEDILCSDHGSCETFSSNHNNRDDFKNSNNDISWEDICSREYSYHTYSDDINECNVSHTNLTEDITWSHRGFSDNFRVSSIGCLDMNSNNSSIFSDTHSTTRCLPCHPAVKNCDEHGHDKISGGTSFCPCHDPTKATCRVKTVNVINSNNDDNHYDNRLKGDCSINEATGRILQKESSLELHINTLIDRLCFAKVPNVQCHRHAIDTDCTCASRNCGSASNDNTEANLQWGHSHCLHTEPLCACMISVSQEKSLVRISQAEAGLM